MQGLPRIVECIADEAALQLGLRGRGGSLRTFVAGVFWILRTGAPWRDLPARFGNWNSVFRRFRRWALSGRWTSVLERVRRVGELGESLLLDSTIIKAHPDAAGARNTRPEAEALGRSRGGFTTKVHALVTASGRWVSFVLTPGQAADIRQAVPLLEPNAHVARVVADRAYDSDAFVTWLADRAIEAVIPSRRGRRHPRRLDRGSYRERNVIERFFGRLKRFRRVGTRTDKTASSFGTFVGLGAIRVERTRWT